VTSRILAAAAVFLFYGFGAGPTVRDLDGREVRPVGSGVTVLLFTRTDCPISNRYAPEMRRIHEAFAAKGVAFHAVYVDRRQPVEEVRRHVREYGYPFGAIIDVRHELVKIAGATMTPEAAVFMNGKLIYRGRIDDRYVTFGTARQRASRHDLEEVLSAAAAGKPLPFRTAKAVGCFIEDLAR